MEGKELWNILCKEYEYRFFSGVPFSGIDELYQSMDPEIMHYVPAANEHIAVKLSSGSWVSGFKSGVLLSPDHVSNLDLNFNVNFKIPVMLITIGEVKGIYSNSDVSKVVSYIENRFKPAVLVLE